MKLLKELALGNIQPMTRNFKKDSVYARLLSEVTARQEKLFETLMPEIRANYPDIFVEDPKYCGVQELGESGMELKVIGKVNEENIFSAPRILNREIKLAFDKAGIEIPFKQVVIHNK